MQRTNLSAVTFLSVLLFGLVISATAAGGTTETLTRGEPDIDASVPEPELVAGTETEVEMQLQNDGDVSLGVNRDLVTTARGVTFEVTDEGPFDVKSGTSSVGTLTEESPASVTQRIKAPSDLEPGEYDITVEVDYSYTRQYSEQAGVRDDRSGSTERTLTLVVADEPRFEISNLQDTLTVGYDGEITGEVTNTGSKPVDDAVLVVEPMSDSLHVEDTRYALSELEAGAVDSFRYPTDVSGQADSGARQVRFTVEYTGDSRETQTTEPISQRVVVDDLQDEFALETVNATVKQGESSDFVLEITNQRPETLSNIDADLYTNSPLDSNNDDAFVSELEPNESATIEFDVLAAGDASTEGHPVELDFQYDTERGDTIVSDVYQQQVTVEAGEESGGLGLGSIVLGGALLLSAVGIGITVWRRTQYRP